MKRAVPLLLLLAGVVFAEGPVKSSSVFYAPATIQIAKANADAHDWAREIRDGIVQKAAPWLALSDDALWDLMMGPNIPRTWHVWSDGYCPACKKDVRMYEWKIDAWEHRWKAQCPQCGEYFPKNDFEKFHRSGFDEHGVFQPARADRSLLFNSDHPDPNDPLHLFGVDDGEGYTADEHRWRFIGWYVIFGQWKRLVHDGIVNLSAAYAVTGEPQYAYKCAILLDRVGDLYPSFDFHNQGGLVYETTNGTRGQVSTWHDACEEVRMMAYAYDRIYDGAKAQEPALVAYLSRKAADYKLPNPKANWADIQRNIETGIFEETLAHRERIESNYPRTDMTNLVINTVLRWPGNREAVLQQLDAIVEKSTAVDGMSGEKGLAGYSSIAPSALAEVLIQMMRLEPDFLKTVYERRPAIYDAFRFSIDTWCMEEWYPRIGDTGAFGRKNPNYGGVSFTPNSGAESSVYSFFWNLFEVTHDPALVQIIYLSNQSSTGGLPHDLFCADPAKFQSDVKAIIDADGAKPELGSVNKQNWRLAIMRSGKGADRRALWLDYDSDGNHSHQDGMNIGYFAKGLDLIPDFGYPPVGYGGWAAPRATWYMKTASHATVVVDGKNQRPGKGTTTLWSNGAGFHAMRAACPEMIGGDVYERTVALIDLDAKDSYIVDVFRVKGGADHAKFFGSSFGTIVSEGLTLSPSKDFGGDTQMRNFTTDPAAKPGWSADWTIQDSYGYIAKERAVHVKYTDFTTGAAASLCEAWVDTETYGGSTQWVPRVMVRRKADAAPLESTFVSVTEPYESASKIKAMRRVNPMIGDTPAGDDVVALEIDRVDGKTDVVIVNGGDAVVMLPDGKIASDGAVTCVTVGEHGIENVRAARVRQVSAEGVDVKFGTARDYFALAE